MPIWREQDDGTKRELSTTALKHSIRVALPQSRHYQHYCMKQQRNGNNAADVRDVIVEAMQDKKARDIVVLNLQGVSSAPVDYFVICNGDSDRQVEAIAKSIDEKARKELRERPWHFEGMENREWVLLDYVNVVAHVFQRNQREFYSLEELWGDAQITHVDTE